jgi:hypothetical protein
LQKRKVKEARPKGTPKILMPLRGQQNFIGGTNLGVRPDGTQAKHLWGCIDNPIVAN